MSTSFGRNSSQARLDADEALKIARQCHRVEIEAALAFAMAGDTARLPLAQGIDGDAFT
jgi:hypothetical protein